LRALFAIAALCLIVSFGGSPATAQEPPDSAAAADTVAAVDSTRAISIVFPDRRPRMSVEAYVRGGAYYLSDIQLSAAFGVSIKWDPLFRLLTMAGRKGEAVAAVGGTAVAVDGRAVNLPDKFLEGSGVVLIPFSFLALELQSVSGCSVSWDEESGVLAAASEEPSVLEVTLGGRPDLARVTVATSRPLAYRVLEDEGELRLAVKGAVPDSAFEVKGTPMSPIRSYSVEWNGDELILELNLTRHAKSFQTFREDYPQSIALLVSSAAYREGFDLEPLAGAYRRWGRARTIVLDPAHGGDDWGSIGKNELKEKDIVLQICRKAASIIEDRLGINVYLTRDSDYRMPPAGRAEMANSRGAELYVSVHCDSWPGGGRRGFGAYVLPPAVKEGGYWRPEARRGMGVPGGETGLELRPWRRAQGRYGRESRKLAGALLREMDVVHDGPSHGVREMAVASMLGVDAPAVTVVCGFLDNSRDLSLLASREGRDRVAAAIARGVERYLEQ
jgi:N-acetylmuramoyl-L-alanine amidase